MLITGISEEELPLYNLINHFFINGFLVEDYNSQKTPIFTKKTITVLSKERTPEYSLYDCLIIKNNLLNYKKVQIDNNIVDSKHLFFPHIKEIFEYFRVSYNRIGWISLTGRYVYLDNKQYSIIENTDLRIIIELSI